MKAILDPANNDGQEKTMKQNEAEKLAQEASENLRLAKRIMANMTRRKRVTIQDQPRIVYERR